MKLTYQIIDFTKNGKPFTTIMTFGIISWNFKTFTLIYPKDYCGSAKQLLRHNKQYLKRMNMIEALQALEAKLDNEN